MQALFRQQLEQAQAFNALLSYPPESYAEKQKELQYPLNPSYRQFDIIALKLKNDSMRHQARLKYSRAGSGLLFA